MKTNIDGKNNVGIVNSYLEDNFNSIKKIMKSAKVADESMVSGNNVEKINEFMNEFEKFENDAIMDITVEALQQLINTYPPESSEWWNIKNTLSDCLKYKTDYDKYLLCVASGDVYKFLDTRHKLADRLCENKMVKSIKRNEAEYDIRYRQLIVALGIVDNLDNVLLLYSYKGRIQNKYTLIQGHVEYDPSSYNHNFYTLCDDAVYREVAEEIILPTEFDMDMISTDKVITQIKDETDKYHVTILHKFKYDGNLHDIVDKIASNEPSKHSVHIINARETKDLELDTVSREFIKMLL